MAGTIRIGISGWTYPPWRGVFYPEGLPQKRELDYAAGRFASIEVNGTFYGLQRPESFAHWAERTPDDFVFSIKGSRYITHLKRLRGIEQPLANFFASGLLRLGPKLGPLLWQFPPSMKFDPELFEAFLGQLPRTPQEAERLAARHEARLEGRVWVRAKGVKRLRHAVEIRHDSFRDQRFVDMLKRYKAALVCADTVEWPRRVPLLRQRRQGSCSRRCAKPRRAAGGRSSGAGVAGSPEAGAQIHAAVTPGAGSWRWCQFGRRSAARGVWHTFRMGFQDPVWGCSIVP